MTYVCAPHAKYAYIGTSMTRVAALSLRCTPDALGMMWMARFCRATATALALDPAHLFARARMLRLSPEHARARFVLPPTLSEAKTGVLSADLQAAQAAAYSAAMR